MNNPTIGEMASRLLDMEDAGKTATPAYRSLEASYIALKARPESWPDVPSRDWTPEQRALAVADGICGQCGRSSCDHAK